jgi:hypothetical protein
MPVAKSTNNTGTTWPSGFVSLINCQPGTYPLCLTFRDGLYEWLWGDATTTTNTWPTGTIRLFSNTQGTLRFTPDATPPAAPGDDWVTVS